MNHLVNPSVALVNSANDLPGVVALERDDHEVAHRGRLEERLLVDADATARLSELGVA